MKPIKLISWNTAGRLRKLNDQLNFLLNKDYDIICLQEVIYSTNSIFKEELTKNGFNVISNLPKECVKTGKRKYNLIIASKCPVNQCSATFKVDWKEKYLESELMINGRSIKLLNIHIPPGSGNKWKKIQTIQEAFENIKNFSSDYKIICGDWNTPQSEDKNGEITTWGEKPGRGGKGSNWDIGERLLLQEVNKYGLIDCFRSLNGYHQEEFSWVAKSGKKPVGRRYDHIYLTSNLNPKKCYYEHSLRMNNLSDHSGIVCELEI